MFRPQNRAAAHMGMDAVVHGDLPGHQHIVQSLRAMSGISKIFPGREMLPVQYQQIGSQTLGDKAPVGQSQGAGRIAGKLAYVSSMAAPLSRSVSRNTVIPSYVAGEPHSSGRSPSDRAAS